MSIQGMKEEVLQFLKENGMSYKNINFEEETSRFVDQMTKGLSGSSSLKMIPAYIDPSSSFSYGEPIIAVDAGGTNFRRAVVTIDEDGLLVDDYKMYPMPGVRKAVSKDQFFKTIVEYIEPILDKSDKIGFCFSYPVEILPSTDGRVLSLTKELEIIGIESTLLGETLNRYLIEKGYKDYKKVSVLNDTTAVLLSGMGIAEDSQYESYIGLILGTGTNTCYIESNENITKDRFLFHQQGHTLINIESGAYVPLCRGTVDKILDEKSMDSGNQLFEKMISGAYQGPLVFETLVKAAKEGCITSNVIKEISSLSSMDVSRFLSYPYSTEDTISESLYKYGTHEDRIKIYYIMDALIERAAMLLAMNIKGILKKTNKGKNPCKPVCLTIDGSTFYESPIFQNKFDYYIKTHLENKGLYIKRIQVESGPIIGAAMAALMG